MKVLLDIKDHKADLVMGILNDLPYVKTTPIKDKKTEFLDGLREAVAEVKLAKQGKIKLQSFDDFLNEL